MGKCGELEAFWHTDEGFIFAICDNKGKPIVMSNGDTTQEALDNLHKEISTHHLEHLANKVLSRS